MGLIKHRPRIKLMTAPELAPGAPFDVTLLIEARRPLAVEFINVDLEGIEERGVGRGQYRVTRARQLCRARARVSDKAELAAGTSKYRARFQLADNTPPSYSGVQVRVTYIMRVRICIPWWPDARASFELTVGRDQRGPRPAPKPLLFSSRPEGPQANEPHVEVSLSTDAIHAGGVVAGAAALNNVEYARYAGLRLALVGVEYVTVEGRNTSVEAHRYELFLPVEQPEEGQQIPFHMRIPRHVPTTYDGTHWRLTWQFECKAEIKWGQDLALRVPVVVHPWNGHKPASSARRAPPTVGSERVQAVWRAVANARDLHFDGRRIFGTAAGCEVTIEREHRGRRGVFLVGRLRYEALHLGLHIAPEQRILRTGRQRDVPLGNRRWDREHRATSRDPSQLRAIVDRLRPGLLHFKTARMTDDTLVAELRNAGVSKSRLDGFAGSLLAAARTIAEMRADIPPPAAMADALSAWSELASALDGTLETARMGVVGTLAGLPTEIVTEWSDSGEASHTTLRVHAPMILDSALRGLYLGPGGDHLDTVGEAQTLEQLLSRLAGEGETERARPDGLAWLEEALCVEISAESLTLSVLAPIRSSDAALGRLRGMVQWVREASGTAGPYR